MPLPASRTARSSFATPGALRATVFLPAGPPKRLTSRSTNDVLIRTSTPLRIAPRAATSADMFRAWGRAGLSFATAYADFSQGVVEGLGDSLKSAWSLVSHDMWQLRTYTELATTVTALGLIQPFNIAGGLADAHAFDKRWGTHVAQRQLEIMQAINKLVQDVPRWTPRQWGHAVGRLVGDIVLAKGAGAAAKVAVGVAVAETVQMRTIATQLQKLGSVPAGASRLAKARAVVPVYTRFTSVRVQIPFRNVRTLPNRSAFWSGLEGSSAEAKALARANGRTSLEMTPGGMWLEKQTGLLGQNVDWFGQMRPQWARMSRRFAQQARGSVEVYRGPKFDPVRSIWITEEKGALEASQRAGRVSNIVIKQIPKK